jgi:hypothetical protein
MTYSIQLYVFDIGDTIAVETVKGGFGIKRRDQLIGTIVISLPPSHPINITVRIKKT